MQNNFDQEKARIKKHVVDGTPADIVERYAKLTELAKTLDFGDLDRNVVVVDTETTGFSFVNDELIQIAAARYECGEIIDWYITFVNPGKPIPEDVAHLTNIHDEHVADAISPEEALMGLVAFAGDAKMIAHNAEFDKTFTTRHPQGYPLLENTWIDSLDLSRIALPKLKSHRLIDLVHTFDAPVSTHRADADVAATCAIYRILLAGVVCMPKELVREIADMATPEEWSTVSVFKYLAEPGSVTFAGEDGNKELASSVSQASFAEGNAEGEDAVAEGEKKRRFFSLRSLRRKRILQLKQSKPKVDAAMIAADPFQELKFPSNEEVAAAFDNDGLLGHIYPSYEPRDEQRTMATAIAHAFSESRNLVVEAGTGVGKSMAYLVPAALTAKKNNITVGIATKTNALLDQLVYQELPALAAALAGKYPQTEPLTYAPLKGISHYPCLRKIDHVVESGPGMRMVNGKEASQAPALAGLLSFVEQSEYEDMDTLKIDYRAMPRYLITTTSTECLKRKCPYFGSMCFGHGARRQAETADVIVTNHSLLFIDLAADGGLLPPVRYWVVDEAHDAEPEARKAFTETVDCAALLRLCGRISDSAGSRNVFSHVERKVAEIETDKLTLLYGLSAKAKSAANSFTQVVEEFATQTKELLYYDTSKNKNYEHIDLWLNDEIRHSSIFNKLRTQEKLLVEAADKLILACQNLVAALEGIDSAAEAQREVATVAMELKEMRAAAESIFEHDSDAYAYQAQLNRKKDKLEDSFEALPLDIGVKTNESLFSRTHSVIFTSATISVNQRFDVFLDTMGLGQTEESAVDTLQLDSSYDFDNNMIIYVVKDMPEPNAPAYLPTLEKLLIATHRAQQGSMLTLFTNRREMEKCYEVVQPELKKDDLRVVCQKWGVSVKGLRDEFVADETLSLFALKSFWQGFDAPGATLKGVIIPKLPFARPTDPLFCERAAHDDSAWRRYVLPKAIIETKQAAGRLIRKADDHGVLILADKRLLTKNYGKQFLRSLQSKTVRYCTIEEIASALRMMG